MKRIRLTLGLVVGALSLQTGSQAITITELSNTGVDAGGNPLAPQSTELKYLVQYRADEQSSWANATAIVQENGTLIGGAWVSNPADARWISPWTVGSKADPWVNDAVGDYLYTLTFTLPNNVKLDTVSISGSWATDNSGVIWINGTATSIVKSDTGFKSLAPFNIASSSQFTPGENTLSFFVHNLPGSGNPSGLLVSELQGSYAVPDGGSTLVLIGSALVAIVALRGRLAGCRT